MTRYALRGSFCMILLATMLASSCRPIGLVRVTAPVLRDANDFQVTFTGIICTTPEGGPSAALPYDRYKAMVIKGNFFTKRHTPIIGIHGADPKSLGEASGESVSCDHTYCWTRMHGMLVRIIGDEPCEPSGSAECGSVTLRPSYKALVPPLSDLLQNQQINYEICKGEDRPSGPVAGCVDIQGGNVRAFPFKSRTQGQFLFPDGSKSAPRQFADAVVWSGRRDGIARVQIKSSATGNRWKTVKMVTDHIPLQIAVVNLGHAHRTSTHFALNEKLYHKLPIHLPKVVVNGVEECDPDRKRCFVGLSSLIDVEGCSNTRP